MPVFDGAAGDSPPFAAFVMPEPTSLRPAVRDRQTIGLMWLTISLVGVAALLIAGRDSEVLFTLVVSLLFGVTSWWLEKPDSLRTWLQPPRQAADTTPISTGYGIRMLLSPLAVIALCVACFVLDFSPAPLAIILAIGVLNLIAAAKLRRWERRDGRMLFTAGPRLNDLYAR